MKHALYDSEFYVISIKSIIIILPLLLAANCGPKFLHSSDPLFNKPVISNAVIFEPGDVIDIKFFHTPEINESQTIRPDGKISLQLLGDFIAAGKTPDSLREELLVAYKNHLTNPEITVIAKSLNSRKVYVGGEVNAPGLIPIPGHMTAIEAIMNAGGFNMVSAKTGNVVLLRFSENKWHGTIIKMDDMIKGKEQISIHLEPRDILYVPRTTITKIDQWIDLHINKIIPTFINPSNGSAYVLEKIVDEL